MTQHEMADPRKPKDREYIVKCYSYTGPAWLHAGKDGPAWYFEGSDLLVDNDEVEVIRKVINEWADAKGVSSGTIDR